MIVVTVARKPCTESTVAVCRKHRWCLPILQTGKAMNPGPELDALIHETIFKMCVHDWLQDNHGRDSVCRKCRSALVFTSVQSTPRYSTDMGRAWLIVEKMQGRLLNLMAQPDGH